MVALCNGTASSLRGKGSVRVIIRDETVSATRGAERYRKVAPLLFTAYDQLASNRVPSVLLDPTDEYQYSIQQEQTGRIGVLLPEY